MSDQARELMTAIEAVVNLDPALGKALSYAIGNGRLPPEAAANVARALGIMPQSNGHNSTNSAVTLGEVRRFFGSVTWEWPGYIPRGHVTLIAGESGLGKSWLMAYLIAAHLGLKPWPDGTPGGSGGKVLLLETEQLRGVYAERLGKLGVPDDAVILLPPPEGSDVQREVYVPDILADIGRIEAFAKEHGVSLIAVDSLSGGHSLDENSSEVRAVLAALSRLAASLGVAVIVVHHARKKGALESPRMTLDRVRGSSAISQFARSVFGLWKPVPDREAVRVDCLKSNFAKPFAPLGFEVSDDGVAFVEPPEEPREPTAVDKAAEFLRVQLRKGPQKFSDLLERAEAEGISKNSLYRAKEALSVVSVDGKWGLPSQGG
jgi:hypothetical protein